MFKRALLGLLALLVVAAVAAVFGFRYWLRGYLESDRFRVWLEKEVSAQVGAPGTFATIRMPSADSLYSDRFHASGGDPVKRLLADQIRADVRFALLSRSAVVQRVEVERLQLVLGNGGSSGAGGAVSREGRDPVQQWEIRRFDLAWPGGSAERLKLTARPGETGGETLLNAEEGKVEVAGMAWSLVTAAARFRGGTLYLSEAQLRYGERGEAKVAGTFAPGQLPEMQARFAGLPVDGYLPDDWRARLTGRLSGHLEWKPLAGQPVVEGEVRLTDGTLSALPMLEKIAVVTRTDRFRSFRLHDASATIRQQGDRVEVRDLKVESTGLLKVEGAFSLRNGEVDGTVNLGVTPAALQWLPGARSRVFTTERDGYLWTPVRLSGPAAHPREDLTARLAAAAVNESTDVIQKRVIDNARDVLDAVTPLLPFP